MSDPSRPHGSVPTAAAPKILVMSPEPGMGPSARATLEATGYTVILAGDRPALEVLGREAPDVVVIAAESLLQWGLDGCHILKARSPRGDMPVLVVDEYPSPGAARRAAAWGADDFLGGPYSPEDLRGRVDALVRIRKLSADPAPAPGLPPVLLAEILPERESSQTSVGPPAQGATPKKAEEIPPDLGLAPDHYARLAKEFDAAQATNEPFACLRVASQAPASAGSAAQVQLRRLIDGSLRGPDFVVPSQRGGFLVVLPQTYLPGALTVAERIVGGAGRAAALGSAGPVSVGVVLFPNKDTDSLGTLLEFADAALERARLDVGGRICLFQHQGYLYSPEDP